MTIEKSYNIKNNASYNALIWIIWERLKKAKSRCYVGYTFGIESNSGRYYNVDFCAFQFNKGDYRLIITDSHSSCGNTHNMIKYPTRTALYKDLKRITKNIIYDYRDGYYNR